MRSLQMSVYLRETKKAGVRGCGEALKIEVSLEVKSLMQNVNVLLCKCRKLFVNERASLPLPNAGIITTRRTYSHKAHSLSQYLKQMSPGITGFISPMIFHEGHTNSHRNHKKNDLSQKRRFVFLFPHNSLDACKPGL